MNKPEIEDIYPLSPMQHGLLFQSLYDSGSQAYFVQITYRFSGDMKQDIFEQTWNHICQRHAVLRTAFMHDGVKRPVQVVLKERRPEISFVDLRDLSEVKQQEHIEAYKLQDRERGFDLQKDMLMRIRISQCGKSGFIVIWSYHHILMDGWCSGILQREFYQIYQSLIRGQMPTLPTVAPYCEYIKWLERQDKEGARAYWSSYLCGYEQLTTLPRLKGKTRSSKDTVDQIRFNLEETKSERLRDLAACNGVTLNIVLQAIWGIILSRYNNTKDILFGSIVSGRPSGLKGVEDMIGLFINAIPVRMEVHQDQRFSDLLRTLQQRFLEGAPHHHLPLAEIQAQSTIGGSLFDHLFVFENYPVESHTDKAHEFSIEGLDSHDRTHYDLSITVAPDYLMGFKFTYNPDIYSRDQIERTIDHLKTVISDVLQAPNKRLSDVRLLSEREREQIIHGFNNTAVDYQVDKKTIIDIFEEQVEQSPNSIAVVFEDQQLTYRGLNDEANRLAHYLQNLGVGPDVLVGICMERSLEMVIGFLGVLKAGGIYMPLDPDYPEARLAYMMEDARISVLLTHSGLVGKLPETTAKLVCLDEVTEALSQLSAENLVSGVMADNLAYVIYTSGSTGAPKGVMVDHAAITQHIKNSIIRYQIEPGDKVLQFASLSFDASIEQILSTWCGGARLVLLSTNLLQTKDLQNIVHKEQITIANLPPAYWQQFLQGVNKQNLESLKLLILGGDALTSQLAQQTRQILSSDIMLLNAYGPTEATVTATLFEVTEQFQDNSKEKITPIGQPITNTRIYILDCYQKIVPIGVPGEIHIGGYSLARGYVNRPDLTAERFIPNPFSDDTDTRLYKTGDLARYLSNGNIEFLGRIDNQVKIRGFRIELGEIEMALEQHPGVRENAVITYETPTKEKDLVAYLVSHQGEVIDNTELRDFLIKGILPDYMIPSAFVFIKTMPLTPNGKIDRKALQKIPVGSSLSKEDFVAPRDQLEEQLTRIWSEVLQVERLGIFHNFFELGGHSLKAIQVISRIHQEMEVKINIRDLFTYPTISELARMIRTADRAVFSKIDPAPQQDYYPLSYAQKRLWFLHYTGGNVAYNMPKAYLYEGVLRIDALKRAFDLLVERHEALRTAFIQIDGEPVQKIYPNIHIEVKEIDLSDMEEPESQAREIGNKEAITSFDLTKPPLFRVLILKTGENRYIFILNMHHIIGDGWSMSILYNELKILYSDCCNNSHNSLNPLRTQYKDFAVWQNNRGFEKEEAYWLGKLSDMPELLNLPYDMSSDDERDFLGSSERLLLDPSILQRFQRFALEKNTTLSNLVMAMFMLLLFKLTDQNNICIGFGTANRIHPDIENLIGFFVNVFPIRTYLTEETEFEDLLDHLTQNMNEAHEHQDYPFDLLIRKLNPDRYANYQPIFNVMYGFQNYSDLNVGTDYIHPAIVNRDEKTAFSNIEPFRLKFETSKFDLLLTAFEDVDRLHLVIEYDKGLFFPETIRQYLSVLKRFAQSIVNTEVDIKND
ncbi:MAG: amino acid adenylation domain-containing protein [Colwellia sp.]|nr:amino acid adenylation domain-containing protein [Colwellia sp.]